MKKKRNSLLNNINLCKGGVDAGTVYGVLLLALVVGGAYMMLGNIDPSITSPDQDQQVIVQNPTDKSVHSNLQLKDFAGITLTPTPTPSPTPTPTPTKALPPGGGPLPLPGPGGGPPGGVGYKLKVNPNIIISLRDKKIFTV